MIALTADLQRVPDLVGGPDLRRRAGRSDGRSCRPSPTGAQRRTRRVVPSDSTTSTQGRSRIGSVAASTRVGSPSPSNTTSPGRSSPIVVQPLGVGTSVSRASAFPSSRATRSSGSATRSRVEPSTNSPGCRMKPALAADLDQLGEVFLRELRIDERRRVVAEHPEVAIDAEVDRRRLHPAVHQRIDDDAAFGERLADRDVGENHGRDTTRRVRRSPIHDRTPVATLPPLFAGVVQRQNISFPS